MPVFSPLKLSLILSLLFAPLFCLAHGGGVDALGCHADKKTGQRHCHNATAKPALQSQQSPPVKPAANSVDALDKKNSHSAPILAAFEQLPKPERVQRIQRLLLKLGYFSGAVTGRVSLETFNAIRLAQKDLGLNADGKASVEFLYALSLSSKNSSMTGSIKR